MSTSLFQSAKHGRSMPPIGQSSIKSNHFADDIASRQLWIASRIERSQDGVVYDYRPNFTNEDYCEAVVAEDENGLHSD